jgi:uncharacterized membrane protein
LARGFIRKLLLSWLLAVVVEYLLLPQTLRDLSGLQGLVAMSLTRVLVVTAVFVVVLYALRRFLNTDQAERWGVAATFAVLSALALNASFSWAFFAVCALVCVILVVYALRGWDDAKPDPAKPEKSKKLWLWITVGLTVGFFLFVAVWTAARAYMLNAPTFDFGIFAQMFYHMKETGLPNTTVERDGLLSHFAVHVSPIYYLLLPFYCLAPVPETLQVLQAAVMASAVIPLWLICKRHNLPGAIRMLVCALLLLYPAFAGGAAYDIHENCFLTPLILWLLYGIDADRPGVTTLAGVLTLMVKEDAPVYVAVIALWLIVRTLLRFEKKQIPQLILGFSLMGLSLGWFFAATGYLAESGDGVMTYRYQNFMYDGSSSLFTVIKSVLLNPLKMLYECVDSEKLEYIGLTMLPLLGLPLVTRRYERYILLIPYILVNLMSDYQYQHNIMFQYNFGSIACLLYLTAVNLEDLKIDWIRLAAVGAALVISCSCFVAQIVPKATYYPETLMEYRDYYDSIREKLAQIPEDASVAASTYYCPALSQRMVLYDVRYASRAHILETEYVVLALRDTYSYKPYGGISNLIAILERNGYEKTDELNGILAVYHRPPTE